MKLLTGTLSGLCMALALAAPNVLADAETSARLDSIERKLDARGLLDMLNRIEKMQNDIQQLRGDIEVQSHTLSELQRRSREQYLDIDRRLQQLETGQTVAPAATSGGPSVTTQTPTVPATTAPPVVAPVPSTITDAPPKAEVQTPPSPPSAGERAEYDQALAVLREGRYDQAAQAFTAFLASYPNSSYADNASYWLGETYYVTRDFDRALATFNGLTGKYPNSSKAPDSYLKTGYIYYEKQDWPAARQALDTVVSEYPGSTASRLAADRLQRMKKEGH